MSASRLLTASAMSRTACGSRSVGVASAAMRNALASLFMLHLLLRKLAARGFVARVERSDTRGIEQMRSPDFAGACHRAALRADPLARSGLRISDRVCTIILHDGAILCDPCRRFVKTCPARGVACSPERAAVS